MQAAVQIILATYNGEKFLRKQLDSLFHQTFRDFSVLVRDDGSTDNTLSILSEYQQKYPGRISILQDNKKNVGATQNFGILLAQAEADYIFFCDQDDIWLDHKIELSLQAIQLLEQQDNTVPCMVFSDMKAMDENDQILSDSVWQQLHLHPDFFTLNRLLIQNIPHGCTMVINKAMRNLACPVPKEAILHDHWIALLAASCGKWSALHAPTVLLRNHSQNVTRKQVSFIDKLKRFITNFFSKTEYDHFIRIRVQQAKALQLRTSSFIKDEQYDILKDFISLEKISGWKRKRMMIKRHFYRTTFLHTLKMIFRA